MRVRELRSATARASAPGAASWVPWNWRPIELSTTSPKRPRLKFSVTVIGWVKSASMPSQRSQSLTFWTGRVTDAGLTLSSESQTVSVARSICVTSPNSVARPVTLTRSPTATGTAPLPSKTNSASEVSGSVSASVSSSWTKKPRRAGLGPWKSPTTTALTVTVVPGIGVVGPLPWTWWMRWVGAGQLTPTSNENVWFAAIASGGSVRSWSVTFAALIVTSQLSTEAKSVSGSRVKEVGPPLTTAVRAPLSHVIVNQVPEALTGSLKLMMMLLLGATFTAPGAGTVLETA